VQAYSGLARPQNTLIMPTKPHDIVKQVDKSLNMLEED
jgi:hypothetical protein